MITRLQFAHARMWRKTGQISGPHLPRMRQPHRCIAGRRDGTFDAWDGPVTANCSPPHPPGASHSIETSGNCTAEVQNSGP